jgi:hypothetical protein
MASVFGPATTHWSQRRLMKRRARSSWSKSVADYERTKTALGAARTQPVVETG